MTERVDRETVEPFKKGDFDNLRLPHLKRMLALERNERIALLAERDALLAERDRLWEALHKLYLGVLRNEATHVTDGFREARAALKGDQT